MSRTDDRKSIRCSFCGKTQNEVGRLIAGNGAYICDDCVRLCVNIVDEESRAVPVVIACDNSEQKLKHGMYVSVHFISEPSEAIVVPASALFQGEQFNYVFKATDDPHIFIRQRVIIGSSNDDNSAICILEGLSPGDHIITEGGIYLAE